MIFRKMHQLMQITTAWGLSVINLWISPSLRKIIIHRGRIPFLVRCELLQGKARPQFGFATGAFPTLRAVPFTLHTLSKCSLGISQESFLFNVLFTLAKGC